jgi:hypothetical protein
VVPIEPIVPTVTVTAPRLYPLGTIADFMAMWGGVDSSLQPSRPANEDAEKEETQTQESIQQCTASWNFDFGQFADQIEENRFDLGATLGTLFATEAIGTMPKTPSELRGLGVPKSELNPVTSQLSRWSDRLDARWMRDLGRTTGGRLASGAATLGVVFEGFYDIGVIGKAALDATSRIGCGP